MAAYRGQFRQHVFSVYCIVTVKGVKLLENFNSLIYLSGHLIYGLAVVFEVFFDYSFEFLYFFIRTRKQYQNIRPFLQISVRRNETVKTFK